MLKLNLREIARDLDVAIGCFDEALEVLEGLEDSAVTDEHRNKLKELSRICIRLDSLRDETGTMVLERVIHICDVEEAIKLIKEVKEDFKDARSLIKY